MISSVKDWLFKAGTDNVEPALFGGAGGTLFEFGVEADVGEDIGFVDELEDVVVEHAIPLPCLKEK